MVTDGEMRRYAYLGHFIDSIDGFDKFGGWRFRFATIRATSSSSSAPPWSRGSSGARVAAAPEAAGVRVCSADRPVGHLGTRASRSAVGCMPKLGDDRFIEVDTSSPD